MNVDGFKNICQATKEDLLKWLTAQLTLYYGEENVIATKDYLFCAGNIPAMLCSHCDTVHKQQPRNFVETSTAISSKQGIGGDDRCGVYAILGVIKDLELDEKKPYLYFSTDEEVGGAKTKVAAKDLSEKVLDVNFLIELDRKGSSDSVYYKCGNNPFKLWIDSFGFMESVGTNTDICTLCQEWDVAGVNLSVGYYNQHTKEEFVVFSELEDTITKVSEILRADCVGKYEFCAKTAKKSYHAYAGTKDFVLYENVYTLRTCPCYESNSFGSVLFDLNEWTFARVLEIGTYRIKIRTANGQVGWVSQWDIFSDSVEPS